MEQRKLKVEGRHRGQPVFLAGEPLESAKAALILSHGRGSSAQDMLGLAEEFARPGLAIMAAEAAGSIWYPKPFSAPVEQNEPDLSSALQVVEASIAMAEAAGVPRQRIILLGFSQGASLTLTYAARNGQRYGGVIGFSGAIIGSTAELDQQPGSLDGTPVFLGCSDVDPFIPLDRVEATAKFFEGREAAVTLRIYPGMDHQVNLDEVKFVRGLLETMLSPA